MSKIIAAAPDATDVALVLLLAVTHARDRAAKQILAVHVDQCHPIRVFTN